MGVLQKTKKWNYLRLSISTSEYMSKGKKEVESIYRRGTCTPMFIPELFTTAKIQNQSRCLFMDELIDIYSEGFSHKENEGLSFTIKWMDLK